MKRLTSLSLAAAMISTLPLLAGEQVSPTPVAEGNLVEEVHSLRYTIEAQSKQIAGLTEQISELRQMLQAHPEPPGAPLPPTPSSEPAPPAPPAPPAALASAPAPASAPVPAPPAPATAAPAAEAPEPPRAEPVAGGVKHVVAKGETLTSIAKLYNIPVAELHKANKIANDRKLQIGQVLNVPTAKPAEPPTNKKE